MIKPLLRNAIETLVRRFDYRLTDVLSDPPGLAGACERLKARGFDPRTVIDVGVGPGTPWLYAAFPKARFELFEPNDAFRPAIEAETEGLDVGVHYCALGAEAAAQALEVNLATPTSSSMAGYRASYLSQGDGLDAPPTVTRHVDVRRLDDFGPFEGPVLLKLDVEGYEAHVLRGAARALQQVEVIISEVSVAQRTEAELPLGAFLAFVESLGFSLINIAEINAIRRGGPIAYLDAVFVRSDSPMRGGAGTA